MEDSAILSLFRKRDEAAISETDAKYGALCRSVASRILRTHEDAEECVADAWLRLWRSIPPESPRNLAAYASRVTRNTAIDRLRRQDAARRGAGEMELALDELNDCVSGEGTEDAVFAKELASAVNAFLASLPKRERTVFLRRYYLVEPAKEIASSVGLSEAHVLTMLSRTRKKLRAYLKKEGLL